MTPSSSTSPSRPKITTRNVVMLVELRVICVRIRLAYWKQMSGPRSDQHCSGPQPKLQLRVSPIGGGCDAADAVATSTQMKSVLPTCTRRCPGSSRVEGGRPSGSSNNARQRGAKPATHEVRSFAAICPHSQRQFSSQPLRRMRPPPAYRARWPRGEFPTLDAGVRCPYPCPCVRALPGRSHRRHPDGCAADGARHLHTPR